MNTTTKTLWANVNGVWVDLHIRAYYGETVIFANGAFGVQVDNGVYYAKPSSEGYSAPSAFTVNSALTSTLSGVKVQSTLVTELLDLTNYQKIEVSYNNGQTSGTAQVDVSSISGSVYVCLAWIRASASSMWLGIYISNTQSNFVNNPLIQSLWSFNDYANTNTTINITSITAS